MKEKKCNGYESMFTFLSEEDFLKHLETCEECKKEHERMQKISNLIQEAKPYIKQKRKNSQILKAACAVFIICFTSMSIPIYTLGTNVYNEVIASIDANSMTVEEMGLPVDEYGFLYIN